MRKLFILIRKDLYLTFTDRFALMLNLAAPFAISLIIGMAFGGGGTSDVSISGVGVALVNRDQGATMPTGETLNLGEQLVAFFVSPPAEVLDEMFNGIEMDDWEAARQQIETGDSGILAAVLIPEDFSKNASVQQEGMTMALGQGTITLYYSSGSPILGSVVESVLTQWANQISTGNIAIKVGVEQLIARGAFQAIPELIGTIEEVFQAEPPVTVEVQNISGARQEQQFNVLSFIGPSMAIFFLTFGMMIGAAEIINEEKQWTLQRMMVTPTPPGMILTGKMAAVYVSGVLQLTILLVATSFLGGNWGKDILAIVLLVLVVVAAAAGLGAFIASFIKRSEQIGIYGVAILMVMGVVSGSFTSTSVEFLGGLQILSKLTLNWWGIEAFTELTQGGGLAAIGPHLAVLALMGVVFFSIGVWRFRHRLSY